MIRIGHPQIIIALMGEDKCRMRHSATKQSCARDRLEAGSFPRYPSATGQAIAGSGRKCRVRGHAQGRSTQALTDLRQNAPGHNGGRGYFLLFALPTVPAP
jgi:hypothetical protein